MHPITLQRVERLLHAWLNGELTTSQLSHAVVAEMDRDWSRWLRSRRDEEDEQNGDEQ